VFFHAGKKTVRKLLGFVADFCGIDRSCQPFSVFSVAIASHVYGVAINSGEVVGYEIVCRRCLNCIPLRSLPYVQLSETEYSVGDLIPLTFPDIHDAYSDRLQIEEILKQNSLNLSEAEREFLIREPFELLDYDAVKIKKDLYIDKTRGIVCGSIVGGVIISFAIAVNMQEPYTKIGSWTAAGLLFTGIIYLLFLSATGPKKAFRKKILPSLIKALSPLAPSKEELQATLQKSKSMGGIISRFIKAKELYSQIQSGGVLPSHNSPDSTMQFTFYDFSKRVQTKIFTVPGITIGSRETCDLLFPELAPEHCRVYLSEQGYYAYDLAGGLMINEKSGSDFLKDNDVLYFGAIAIRFNTEVVDSVN
jgi:hypothetical protein